MPLVPSLARWLAVTALVFQALIPFGQGLPSAEGGGGALVICTQFGPRALTPPSDDGGRGAPSGDRASCAVCLSLGGARLGAPEAPALAVAQAFFAVAFADGPGRPATARAPFLPGRPRAPPARA